MDSFCTPRFPKLHLVLLFAHSIAFVLSVMAWWWFFRQNRNLFGDAWVDAHLAFQVIGGIAMFGSSPACYWPYVYGAQMPPSRRRDLTALFLIVSFIFHTFPTWIIEFSLCYIWGMQDVLQGMSLVIMSVVTFMGCLTTWLYYTWTMARILQKYFGSNMRDLHPAGGRSFATVGRRAQSGPPERI